MRCRQSSLFWRSAQSNALGCSGVGGRNLISEDIGLKLEKVTLEDLEICKNISIDKENATIVHGASKPANIEGCIKQIRAEISEVKSDYNREKLQELLANLIDGEAVIRIESAMEIEMKKRKHGWKDALNATRAAVGFVRCINALSHEQLPGLVGSDIIPEEVILLFSE
jgi:chaperonin GroEL